MVSTDLPADVRRLPWSVIQSCTKVLRILLGKGAFGKCYLTQLGPMQVCVKVYHSEKKYANTFFNEVRILCTLVHSNLPLLLGIYNTVKHPRIMVMSYHPFDGQTKSLTVHASLKTTDLTKPNWKSVLLTCVSALTYLAEKEVLHNDIKSDNILVEYLPPDYKQCRSVLIDFGKACYVTEAKLYQLSKEQKQKYKVIHPQVAPEVRDGINKQSHASDIYSFGRIMQHINCKLQIPVLDQLAGQCLGLVFKERPTAKQLLTFFSNLFKE